MARIISPNRPLSYTTLCSFNNKFTIWTEAIDLANKEFILEGSDVNRHWADLYLVRVINIAVADSQTYIRSMRLSWIRWAFLSNSPSSIDLEKRFVSHKYVIIEQSYRVGGFDHKEIQLTVFSLITSVLIWTPTKTSIKSNLKDQSILTPSMLYWDQRTIAGVFECRLCSTPRSLPLWTYSIGTQMAKYFGIEYTSLRSSCVNKAKGHPSQNWRIRGTIGHCYSIGEVKTSPSPRRGHWWLDTLPRSYDNAYYDIVFRWIQFKFLFRACISYRYTGRNIVTK